jgi:arginase
MAEVTDLLTALLASPRVVGLQVAEYDPALDADGSVADKLVDLVVRAVSRRLRR